MLSFSLIFLKISKTSSVNMLQTLFKHFKFNSNLTKSLVRDSKSLESKFIFFNSVINSKSFAFSSSFNLSSFSLKGSFDLVVVLISVIIS